MTARCETVEAMDTPTIRVESKPVPHRYRLRRHATIERGASQVPHAVVYHWTAGWGEIDGLWNYLRRQGADESYNYAVDRSGRCGEFVPSTDAAWHGGDGKLPPPELADLGFIASADVPYVKRVANLRSIGIASCNRGYLNDSGLLEARHRGALVVEARHYNPRSHATSWEGYHSATMATHRGLLALLKRRHPSLRFVLGHQDITNFDAMGTAGSKVDPGPDDVFPWQQLGLAELGLVRVRFDFARHGWAVVE